jgi:hypothetical protein
MTDMNYTKRLNQLKKKYSLEKIKKMAVENPVKAALIAIGVIVVLWMVFSALFSALEIGPEVERAGNGAGAALGADGNLLWLGMEVGDITRGARKEFKIPKKVRGVFVINEGTQEAKQYGILAGDIVCSVNRRNVFNKNAFVNAAKNVKYSDGIMMEIYRDGKYIVVTIPFDYQYGPLFGPNKGHWQLGSPGVGKALPYGRLLNRQ